MPLSFSRTPTPFLFELPVCVVHARKPGGAREETRRTTSGPHGSLLSVSQSSCQQVKLRVSQSAPRPLPLLSSPLLNFVCSKCLSSAFAIKPATHTHAHPVRTPVSVSVWGGMDSRPPSPRQRTIQQKVRGKEKREKKESQMERDFEVSICEIKAAAAAIAATYQAFFPGFPFPAEKPWNPPLCGVPSRFFWRVFFLAEHGVRTDGLGAEFTR